MSGCGCGCCTSVESGTPRAVYNRPALGEIAYRVGTFGGFRRAMVTEIRGPLEDDASLFPLRGLVATDPNDFAIAVVEMAAYVFDILTFYSERAINEAMLRTAVHPESVRRLIALLDYRPLPGLAAVADLAVILEPGKTLVVPIGMRVQSVPGQNEKPQKFETVASIDADATLNRIQILPDSVVYSPGAVGSTHALVISGPTLRPGAPLVAFNDWCATAEDKEVVAMTPLGPWRVLTYKPALVNAQSRMFAWTRKHRLFGAAAPRDWVTSKPDPVQLQFMQLTTNHTNYTVNGPILSLDGFVPSLKAGTRILLHGTHADTVHTITAVTQGGEVVGPLQGLVTKLVVDPPVTVDVDVRTATVYELVEPELELWNNDFPATIPAGATVLTIPAAGTGALAKGRAVIIDDATGRPQRVTVTGVADMIGTPVAGAWRRVTITPRLERSLETATAFMWANVVPATHGETVKDEIVGDGDARLPFQTLGLAKGPVTYVPAADAPGGAASTLRVRMNGVLWSEVDSFYAQPGDARVFITRRDEEAKSTLRFGDGLTGARARTGRANITALYRVGLGSAGNVRAGALRNALDRPVGLKSVVNPIAASGGADPELIDKARTNGPGAVRTFGRVISLRDLEDEALRYPGIGKARASLEWSGEEEIARLTVAGAQGEVVAVATREALGSYLDLHRDPNRSMSIDPHRPLAFKAALRVLVDPAYVGDAVVEAVRSAITGYFAFERQQLGRSVFLSAIYRVIQETPGVVAARITELQYKDPAVALAHGATGPVEERLLVFTSEIPVIDDPVGDIDILQGLS